MTEAIDPKDVSEGIALDVLAKLKGALISAGVLVELEVLDTQWGKRIGIVKGLGLEQAREVTMTLEAGTEGRVIRG
ncbi:hypothetical protein GTY75_05335 [Streptomyces sp. SID8381]|uniref:hypothetical protein n=1 Tax=unclassified Streptomyces TaxID=2593676 RepID=UPI0003601067|nr:MULTISPECIES: hypothetical protein [unclassified Streptomyces]MYX26096.1 hypothetical protein [Streptomyces sp. SID8381]